MKRKRQSRPQRSRWIQRALSKHKKGALHHQLGIPLDEKIPVALLREAAKESNGTGIGHRARMALTLRGFQKRKHRKL